MTAPSLQGRAGGGSGGAGGEFFFPFFFAIQPKLPIFAPNPIAPSGFEGHNLIGKGRLQRYLRHPNLANSCPEDTATERPLWVYCILLVLIRLMSRTALQYHTAWAIELFILDKACESPDVG